MWSARTSNKFYAKPRLALNTVANPKASGLQHGDRGACYLTLNVSAIRTEMDEDGNERFKYSFKMIDFENIERPQEIRLA